MVEIKIKVRYRLGETVFVRTDPEQEPRMVIGYTISPNGITYKVASESNCNDYFDMELTKTENVLRKLGLN